MKPHLPTQSIWIVTVLLGLLLINCNTLLSTPAPPPPPTPVAIQEVSELTANRTEIPVGETAEITVSVIKLLGDQTPLTFQWSTTGGLITQGQDTCCIVYEAPDTPGGYQVHLTIAHGEQLFHRSLNLLVTGQAVISETVPLEPTPTATLVVPLNPPTQAPGEAGTPLGTAAEYVVRAQAAYARRNIEQALADYSKAIELNYEPLSQVYYERGAVYYAERKYQQAIPDFNQAIELAYEPLSQAYFSRGNAHYYYGNSDQAISDYTKAIDLNHDPLSWLYNSRGLAYRKQGNYDQAIADYTQAIDLGHDPLHWPYYNRGNAYADQGNYDQAIADFNEAISLAPTEPSFYYARGLAYRQKGDQDLAVADFNQVLAMNDDYWRQEAETQLNDLAAQ